jgi:hypothetical protein
MAAAMASPAFNPQQTAELAAHYGLEIRPAASRNCAPRTDSCTRCSGQPLTHATMIKDKGIVSGGLGTLPNLSA